MAKSRKAGRPKQKVVMGREGNNITENFNMPSIGIEDIDRAVFTLFDKTLNFNVTYQGETTKVPVIFATGERFALTRRDSPIRDNNNALILPMISIMRQDLDFSPGQAGKGTAIAFGEIPGYYIKRRLGKEDRNYQNIINKAGLTNQDNVSSRKNFGLSEISPGNTTKLNTQASRRNGKNLTFIEGMAKSGLQSNLGDNIFEIIDIPYPSFVAVKYNIIFWTQYMQQANQIIVALFIRSVHVPIGWLIRILSFGIKPKGGIHHSILRRLFFVNFVNQYRRHHICCILFLPENRQAHQINHRVTNFVV